MRIISGKYKGKVLKGFTLEGTRPTMDRVKESMFAMIQNTVKDSICLDLFAGSGSLGMEAISNGAYKCYFVDSSSEVKKVLEGNLKTFNPQEYIILKSDYKEALSYFKKEQITFDLVFLDPPYHLGYIQPVLDLLIQYKLLNEEATIVCEYEEEKLSPVGYKIIKEKKYREKKVMILKKS